MEIIKRIFMKKFFLRLFFVFSILLFSSSFLFSQDVNVYGTIRKSSGSWFVLNNAQHVPSNIGSIESTSTYIKINYLFTASKVHYLIATPDETFASLGYIIGASVGLSYSYIYIYKYVDGVVVIVDPQTITSTSGNIWIVGEFE